MIFSSEPMMAISNFTFFSMYSSSICLITYSKHWPGNNANINHWHVQNLIFSSFWKARFLTVFDVIIPLLKVLIIWRFKKWWISSISSFCLLDFIFLKRASNWYNKYTNTIGDPMVVQSFWKKKDYNNLYFATVSWYFQNICTLHLSK